ncbi:MAG TPA: hypothetical protein PKE69_26575 [Pyrinomonadaceae bacterium]|nr:hypothetical protein [Pyrinomonadaceae bacterium]
MPTIPPYQIPEKISERIIAVCSCGEYGCDCLTCDVKVEDDIVTFSNFGRLRYSRIIGKAFKFSKENFQELENHLAIEAKKLKEK